MQTARTLQGLAVVLILTVGCDGAPGQTLDARNPLANQHIIGGKDTQIEEIPFQISIEDYFLHNCGGAIISENYAVTAAHCIQHKVSPWFRRIRAGSTSEFLFSWGGVIHHIAESWTHKNFVRATLDYDVGMIRVSTPFQWTDRVRPVALPSAGLGDSFLDFSQKVTTSGWGMTSAESFFTPWHLKSVDLVLMPRKICEELHVGSPYTVTSRMLCAGSKKAGSTCYGDSGGPMVHKKQLIGLVSWGMRCNDWKFPSVFTNVLDDEIRGFIKEHSGV